ncbi:hypothetical protein [Caldithrix abyssi]|uniref:Uncharacterized protein n=1 Tax=Caldithrix abyssi DSM 13497 TaxID=880073 RepID=H1XUY3_CALAY|nr:hypothetical protein [Caldithrix abyssi]APF18843.1 hypothetical protein Cabys_2094 [Caldithrix abyssi DSM 13497]EHO42816.1 hypothetical protein Calab_3210 [Caldithrix abyssi DSM 13497]
MRNLIKILVMATFVFGLVACGGEKKAEPQKETVTTETAQPDTAAKADTTMQDTTQAEM